MVVLGTALYTDFRLLPLLVTWVYFVSMLSISFFGPTGCLLWILHLSSTFLKGLHAKGLWGYKVFLGVLFALKRRGFLNSPQIFSEKKHIRYCPCHPVLELEAPHTGNWTEAEWLEKSQKYNCELIFLTAPFPHVGCLPHHNHKAPQGPSQLGFPLPSSASGSCIYKLYPWL